MSTTVDHFAFPSAFRQIYDHAVARYRAGHASPVGLFDDEQLAWLAAHGLTAQTFFDYAEDDVADGSPGFGHALTIETVRRDYFFNAQNGVASGAVLDTSTLPGKADAIAGISWLPRILPKARAKLRGELPPSLMYCCGGDRRFFRTHNILPAEFLNLVWRHLDDDAAIVAWVTKRGLANT